MLPVLKRPRAVTMTALPVRRRSRAFSTSSVLQIAPRRTRDLSTGYSSSYDPDEEPRGPMFNKNIFGVPQFYPKDLKKRVDEYVVGQERAKKTISSIIFNHYQKVRRRYMEEERERKREEKEIRRNAASERNARERELSSHPVEGATFHNHVQHRYATDELPEDEFPGHAESVHHMHETWQHREQEFDFYLPEDTSKPRQVKIDKSNLLLVGPTGVGKTYILE
jgi:ATP-dependent Clp protease ATP-binding subunit ClpX